MNKKKLINGVGINDSTYVTEHKINNKKIICPFYSKWTNMIMRSYSKPYKLNMPSYEGVSVCKEWHSFMNFKRWMEKQDWEGKELDKDLLVSGNKVYSPDTCIFISQALNSLILQCANSRGDYPLWVSFHKGNNKLRTTIVQNNRNIHLGYFSDPLLAHQAGQRKKIEIIREAAELEEEKVKNALLRIADKIQCDLDNNLETKEY